jgi:hypothetical protein
MINVDIRDTTFLEKAESDVKIDIKLSTIKPIHTSWIVAAFQQVTKETLIIFRGWEKTCIKEFAGYDYPWYFYIKLKCFPVFRFHCVSDCLPCNHTIQFYL